MATDWLLGGGILPALADHVWQSTLVLLAVWLFTTALRRNRAAVRHRLWLVATAKFILPFGALVMLGQQYGSSAAQVVHTPISEALTTASAPFSQGSFSDGTLAEAAETAVINDAS